MPRASPAPRRLWAGSCSARGAWLLATPPVVLSGPIICCFQGFHRQGPHGAAQPWLCLQKGLNACACPPVLLFLLQFYSKTDLTWAGLWYKAPACPATPRSQELRGRGVTGWRGSSGLGGLCPCGVGVSVPQPGQCGRLPSPSPSWLSNLVIYVELCRQQAPLPSPFLLFIYTLLLSCSCISIPIHLLNKRWESGVTRSFFSLGLFPGLVYSHNSRVRYCVWHGPSLLSVRLCGSR